MNFIRMLHSAIVYWVNFIANLAPVSIVTARIITPKVLLPRMLAWIQAWVLPMVRILWWATFWKDVVPPWV